MGRTIETLRAFRIYDLGRIEDRSYKHWTLKNIRGKYSEYHEIQYLWDKPIDKTRGNEDLNHYYYASYDAIEELKEIIESLENERYENDEELPNFDYTVIDDDQSGSKNICTIRYLNSDHINKYGGVRRFIIEILDTNNSSNTERFEYTFNKFDNESNVKEVSSNSICLSFEKLLLILPDFIKQYSMVNIFKVETEYILTWYCDYDLHDPDHYIKETIQFSELSNKVVEFITAGLRYIDLYNDDESVAQYRMNPSSFIPVLPQQMSSVILHEEHKDDLSLFLQHDTKQKEIVLDW